MATRATKASSKKTPARARTKKAATKKATSKKAASKKAASKKATSKKKPAKATSKKAPAAKASKRAAKKSTARKSTAKKAPKSAASRKKAPRSRASANGAAKRKAAPSSRGSAPVLSAPKSSAEVAQEVRERLAGKNGDDKMADSDAAPTKKRAPNSQKDAKLQSLFEQGKSKGFLTFDEVNDAIPADAGPDQIDDVVGALTAEDIQIVDGATQVKVSPSRVAREEQTKKLAGSNRKESEEVDYYSKSNDPVRMYLRKMGSVALLTREGEVEIAKRIEVGELNVNAAILD